MNQAKQCTGKKVFVRHGVYAGTLASSAVSKSAVAMLMIESDIIHLDRQVMCNSLNFKLLTQPVAASVVHVGILAAAWLSRRT